MHSKQGNRSAVQLTTVFLIIIVQKNLVGTSAAILVAFYRRSGIHIMRKNDVIRKTGSTQHITTSSDEDQATAIGNMRKKR